MIKGSIQQEDITIINTYARNIGTPEYIKQILTNIQKEIDSNTIILGNFNTQFTSMDRSFRQKINMKTLALKDTMNLMDLIDMCVCVYICVCV